MSCFLWKPEKILKKELSSNVSATMTEVIPQSLIPQLLSYMWALSAGYSRDTQPMVSKCWHENIIHRHETLALSSIGQLCVIC